MIVLDSSFFSGIVSEIEIVLDFLFETIKMQGFDLSNPIIFKYLRKGLTNQAPTNPVAIYLVNSPFKDNYSIKKAGCFSSLILFLELF